MSAHAASPEAAEYTVLQVEASRKDTLDALLLIAPAYDLKHAAAEAEGWSTVSVGETDAPRLAPALSEATGQPVLVTTVDDQRCTVSLARPDRTILQAGAAAQAAELATALGVPDPPGEGTAGQRLAWLLADRELPPRERHRKAAELLRVPCPARPTDPGVVAVWASAPVVRSRLPYAGHGAWVVPVRGELCLVVPDGSGWTPSPTVFEGRFTADDGTRLPTLTVSWGDVAGVEARSERNRTYIALPLQQEKAKLRSEARDLADALGLGDRGEEIAGLVSGRRPAGEKCGALLAAVGIDGVPAGGSELVLANWAAEQAGAIHVTAGSAQPVAVAYAEPGALPVVYRRRRVVRRVRSVAGWLEFAGWVLGFYYLIFGPRLWAAYAFGAVAALIAIRVALKRRLDPPSP